MNTVINDSLLILKSEREKVANELARLNDAIALLEGDKIKPVDWRQRSMSCLKKRDKVMQTVEILECMFINEPQKLSDDKKRRNYVTALSIALNNLCADGILDKKVVSGKKGHWYGFKHWFKTNNVLSKVYDEKLEKELNYEIN